MSKFKFAIILATLSLLLTTTTGCSFTTSKPVSTKTDVLLAQDCGMDGLKCCANEPKCSYGQECCVDPNNSSNNQCADKCGCGKQDQFCCANNQCDSGFACSKGKCTKCGGENQPCCSQVGSNCLKEKVKGRDLVCFNNICVSCGNVGVPCCVTGKNCFGSEGQVKSLAECNQGICQLCGGDAQKACLSGEKCLQNYLFNSDKCYQCGDLNQPCCDNKACNPQKKLKCVTGFCQE